MDSIQRLKEVDVRVPFVHPKRLEALALDFKESKKYTDQSSFEFPPKPIEKVVALFLGRKYNLLNFFDIVGLLYRLEKDELSSFTTDKDKFTQYLQELFNFTHRQVYVKNSILKVVTKIFLNTENNNSFKKYLSQNMTSNEFIFIKFCIEENFESIQKVIKNNSLKKVLRSYSLDKPLSDSIEEYPSFLLKKLSKSTITDELFDGYNNNLLVTNDSESLSKQVDKIITLIERNSNLVNSNYLDKILLDKLGNIEDKNSKWNTFSITSELKYRYRSLKGLFEFQRFVEIAKYLSPSLENSNVSRNGKTSDATRISNRSAFWSNYAGKFSSVKMWVSEEDYRKMSIDNSQIALKDIRQLQNIENEACLLEFKESNLLILIFFRNRDSHHDYHSLIFEDSIDNVKALLYDRVFDTTNYLELKRYATYEIREHYFIWQGWVDKYLVSKGIYPNQNIYEKKEKFKSALKVSNWYEKEHGLQRSRESALVNNHENRLFGDRASLYENVIRKKF